MPDETISVTLPASDYQTLLAGLMELPGKFGIPVINRLQTALAEAQKPAEEVVPFAPVKGSKSNG